MERYVFVVVINYRVDKYFKFYLIVNNVFDNQVKKIVYWLYVIVYAFV